MDGAREVDSRSWWDGRDGIQWKYRARLPFSEREKPGDIGLDQRLCHYSMKIWMIFIKEE